MLVVSVMVVCAVFSIWVYWDATAHGVGKIQGIKAWWNMPAWAWAVVCLGLGTGLGILAVPAYLFKRSELIRLAKENPVQEKGRIPKLVLLAVAGALIVAAYLPGPPRVPECQSPEVGALALDIVRQTAPDATLSNTAEDVAASRSDVRVCRTQIHSGSGPDEALRFEVSLRGDSEFVVRFLL